MLSSAECFRVIGDPVKELKMKSWVVPEALRFGPIPKKIYCSIYLPQYLEKAFQNIIDRGLKDQLKTWDGCFNIRKKVTSKSQSLHSWGLAIDVNAADNGYGKPVTMTKEFIQCFKDAGFDAGADWRTPDGMHFQIKKLG